MEWYKHRNRLLQLEGFSQEPLEMALCVVQLGQEAYDASINPQTCYVALKDKNDIF